MSYGEEWGVDVMWPTSSPALLLSLAIGEGRSALKAFCKQNKLSLVPLSMNERARCSDAKKSSGIARSACAIECSVIDEDWFLPTDSSLVQNDD